MRRRVRCDVAACAADDADRRRSAMLAATPQMMRRPPCEAGGIVYDTVAPKGVRPSFASLKHCLPKGIPMMVMHQITPAKK